MDEGLLLLLGRAKGWLEAQPVGPPRANYSRRAYLRYAKRGLDGFAAWDVDAGHADHLVRAGIRLAALERLEAGARDLGEAIASRDVEAAERAAEEAREALALLRTVPYRRRGQRNQVGDQG